MASDEVLQRYFDAFAENYRPIIVHEYASHVLQALMVLAARHSLVSTTVQADCNLHLKYDQLSFWSTPDPGLG